MQSLHLHHVSTSALGQQSKGDDLRLRTILIDAETAKTLGMCEHRTTEAINFATTAVGYAQYITLRGLCTARLWVSLRRRLRRMGTASLV